MLTRFYIVVSDAQGQLTPKWWNSAKIQTHPSFYGVLVTCKNEEDPIKDINHNFEVIWSDENISIV